MNPIKERREQLAYTQKDLAKEAGLSLRTIQRLEKSQKSPKGYTLNALAEALDVEPMNLQKGFEKVPGDNGKLAIQLMNISVLAFILLPLGNLILPYLIWKKHRTNAKADEYGRRILNFQLIWTVLFFLSLALAPFIQGMLGWSGSLILWVLLIGLGLNFGLAFRNAYLLQKDRYDFLDLPIRFF